MHYWQGILSLTSWFHKSIQILSNNDGFKIVKINYWISYRTIVSAIWPLCVNSLIPWLICTWINHGLFTSFNFNYCLRPYNWDIQNVSNKICYFKCITFMVSKAFKCFAALTQLTTPIGKHAWYINMDIFWVASP